MDFDEEEPTQMELNPNPALHTGATLLDLVQNTHGSDKPGAQNKRTTGVTGR